MVAYFPTPVKSLAVRWIGKLRVTARDVSLRMTRSFLSHVRYRRLPRTEWNAAGWNLCETLWEESLVGLRMGEDETGKREVKKLVRWLICEKSMPSRVVLCVGRKVERSQAGK